MIITDDIKQLVYTLEASDINFDANLLQLIQKLHYTCSNFNFTYNTPQKFTPYPVEDDGYALAVDALEDESLFHELWNNHGFVVGKDVVKDTVCDYALQRMQKILDCITHVDDNNTPIVSRGFFEIYHDNSLAMIRQSLRLYIHHVLIWKTPFLWTSFDRFGIKFPGDPALPLHVDQNHTVHATFTTVQGVLALEDCPVERGTFLSVPGSQHVFNQYVIKEGYIGEYVELCEPLKSTLTPHAQAIAIRKGCIVSWDSRTTHANTANLSQSNRYVAYISAGKAKSYGMQERYEVYTSGLGSNVRDLYLHASKKPRYTNASEVNRVREIENLNLLGKLLYGFVSYDF